MVTTAIGRRFQLFSPSPAKNGSRMSQAENHDRTDQAAPGVSICGGSKASSAYSHWKK